MAYFWVNSTMAKLCAKALEHDIEIDYVQDLIRRRNLIPDVPVLHLDNWPWPLKIQTLGQFEIIRDSEAVRFTGKVQQKTAAPAQSPDCFRRQGGKRGAAV